VYGIVPYVHFIHSLPEEIEVFKTRSGNSILRGAEKAEIQIRQCKTASLVVAIGPRIHREMANRIEPNSTVPVVALVPGLDTKLLAHRVNLAQPRSLHCLFMARLEDGELKGAGLACRLIRSLNCDWSWPVGPRPRLIMRGFDPEQVDKQIAAIGDVADAKPYLFPRPYTSDVDEVASDIRSASVVVMPSRREGYGLVAMEGIAAGIPVLVSAESDVAELLLDHDIAAAIGKSLVEKCVADVDGDADTIKRSWATRVYDMLSNPVNAFEEAERIRSALRSLLTWQRAAEQLSSDMETILRTAPVAGHSSV
jgi:glycosyltransferase involved in cell wall biosynthesis